MNKDKVCKQETDKILLVEGVDDCHVVRNLCKAHGIIIPDSFGIYECEGADNVLKRLNALVIRPNPPKVIGILLDADKPTDNPSVGSRLDSIKGKLKDYSYHFPKVPDPNGTIIPGYEDKPKLGFWLMPNNQDVGMLEDFCIQLANPELLEYAKECVEKVMTNEISTFNQLHLSKAVIHTYLAWCDEPGYPLGKAITAQSLIPRTAIATQFTDWLNRLFI